MSTAKKMICGYLYADGHAIIVWEKQDPDAGEIQYVEVHEKFTEASCDFQGRLIFSRYNLAMLDLAKRAKRIHATEASVKNGSENTQRMGIRVGSLIFENTSYSDGIHFSDIPDLMCGSYTYQSQTVEECPKPDEMHWGNYRIARFHAVKKPAPRIAVAA